MTVVVHYLLNCGFPWWLSGQESACQCRRSRLDSWVGEDPLEEEMETYSSIIAGRGPWTQEPGRLQVHEVAKEADTT